MKSGKDISLSNIQLGLLIMGFLYGSTAIMNPSAGVGRDAWIAVILGWSLGFLLLMVYVKIFKLNPDMTLVEMLKRNFGNVAGTIVSVLYIWYFLHLASLVIRNFGEFMTTTGYTETPSYVIMMLFAALVIYVVKSGLNVLGRVSELVVWIIPAIILTACTALITVHDFSVYKPVLAESLWDVVRSGFAFSTFPFGEAIAFLMIFPHLNDDKSVYKTVAISVSAIGLLFLITSLRDLAVLGPDLLGTVNYSPDITTKLIPVISIEPFVDVNLLIGGGIKAAICIYAASKGTAILLGVEESKPLVTAFAAFALVLSVWLYQNSLEMMSWAKEIWPYYSLPFQYVIPVILLVISLFKNRKREGNR